MIHSPTGASNPCFRRGHSGQAPADEFAQQALGVVATDLEPHGHRREELQQSDIQERAADLERMRHAHPVDFHMDIVGQIGLQVAPQHSLREAQPDKVADHIQNRIAAIVVADSFAESVGVQRGPAMSSITMGMMLVGLSSSRPTKRDSNLSFLVKLSP